MHGLCKSQQPVRFFENDSRPLFRLCLNLEGRNRALPTPFLLSDPFSAFFSAFKNQWLDLVIATPLPAGKTATNWSAIVVPQ